MAVLAFADPAGNANRLECTAVLGVQIVCIDQLVGMANFAAKPYREAPMRRLERPSRTGNVPCQTEIPSPVGRFGQLAQESARGLEGLMDVPEGAIF